MTHPVRTTRGPALQRPGTVIVVHEDELSAILSEFARTVITDFPIQAILDHLVERIAAVLPVSAAGVTLIAGGDTPHYIAASSKSAMIYEELQSELGQGPCRLAFESGEAVIIPDLAAEDRFPEFSLAAVAAGLAATFTFPLRHGHGRLGALDLYSEECGSLDQRDMDAAQTLADVTAAYLLNARAREVALARADRFQHSATHDQLTGLPNRLLLQERLEHATQRAQRSHTNAAVLFADLDRFKRVNDDHGHHVGDELLVGVARRLSTLVRPGDTLARVSGDEFVFLCEDLHSPADVEVLARRIEDALTEPFVVAGVELTVRASVGMAYAGPGEEISSKLIAEADHAMYEAKRSGGRSHGREIYDLRGLLRRRDGAHLEQDLRTAFVKRQLEVHYQPIVRGSDGSPTGVEALLRWTDPQRGAVSPVSMVEVAEASGLIHEIGAWVLERACRDRAAWAEAHPGAPLDVWVNVSGPQLAHPAFLAALGSILDRTGTDPRVLVLEVTEKVFIANRGAPIAVLGDLAQRGVRLAVDGVGSGYSSLGHLHHVPIHIVKMERELVGDVVDGPARSAVMTAITDMAHVLRLAVVATGVETARQRDEVRSVGCDLAQGFFYERPVRASIIDALLANRSPGPLRLPVPLVSVW